MAQYHTPPGDGLEPLIRELKDIRRQLRDLQRPSGTNIGNTANQVQLLVAKVNETLLNIDAGVQASIAANSYTKAVIDELVANPPEGSAVTGNASATGNMSAGGTVSGSTGTFPSGINSLAVHGTLLTLDYKSVYVDSNGRFGYRP